MRGRHHQNFAQQSYQHDIRGRRYKQESLDLNLNTAIAGQTTSVKFLLALLGALLCFILSIVAGYQGCATSVYLSLDNSVRSPYIITVAVQLIWLIAVIQKNLATAVLLAILTTLLGIVVGTVLILLNFLQPFDKFIFATCGLSVIGLAICGGCFFGFRVLITFLGVLFSDIKLINVVIVVYSLVILFSARLGALTAFSAVQDVDYFKAAFSLMPRTEKNAFEMITVSIGIGFTGILVLSSWWANQLWRTFFNYSDPIRTWAVAAGTWRGTSFRNLDVSRVDFRGSTLANSDLRAQKLERTCFLDVKGLERARVDNQYLDFNNPKVQELLTRGSSLERGFQRLNLQGAYLQNADLRGFDFTDANLTGADLKGADLREGILVRTQLTDVDLQNVDLRRNILIDANLTEANLQTADLRDCILVRAQVARADFSGADLTGICIEDWSVSSKTKFTDVRCEYIYRRYQDGQPIDLYPVDRNFEVGEFASLFQQPENELELVFKGEEFDYTALSLTFDKLQTDKPDLKLKLQGIEQRQDLWVVKVTSDDPANVERRIKEIQDAVYQGYEATTTRLENNPLIRRIISDVANIKKTQEEIGEEVNQLAKRIGSNFYFLGGTITNVTGAGEIKYTEASNQVRSLVTGDGHETQVVNTLLNQLRSSNVATTANEQTELIQFVILEEAQRDPQFKQFLLQQAQQILAALPESSIATALRGAIAQLISEGSSNVV